MNNDKRVHDLVIVSCGGQKISHDSGPLNPPVASKNVYTSDYFAGNRLYAERFGNSWCILSAHYGFILPNWPMPRLYNASWSKAAIRKMKQKGMKIDQALDWDNLRKQALSGIPIVFKAGMNVVVLGGKEYVQSVEYAVAPVKGVKVLDPLKGLGIGLKLQAVRKAVAENRPLS